MRRTFSIAVLVMGSLAAVVVLVVGTLWLFPPADSANASGRVAAAPSGDLADALRFGQLARDNPRRALASCVPAQATAFHGLAAHLDDRRDFFGPARFAYQDGRGLSYLSAVLLDARGAVKATAPVWVYGGSGYAALSPSAARFSDRLPDAGARYGAGEQDAAALRAAACSGADARYGSGASPRSRRPAPSLGP